MTILIKYKYFLYRLCHIYLKYIQLMTWYPWITFHAPEILYMIWYDMIWYMIYDIWYMIWYDMIWYDMIWYDMIWYMIWYDIWYDMIWYDIWYDMMWYDMIWDMIYDMIYDMIWWQQGNLANRASHWQGLIKLYTIRADSTFMTSQWEMVLHCKSRISPALIHRNYAYTYISATNNHSHDWSAGQ